MRHDLGVGLALKHIPLLFQLLTQGLIVFNDAVVNQTDLKLVTHTEVRVRIVHVWRAVRGPACVCNPDQPCESIARLRGEHLLGKLTHTRCTSGPLQARQLLQLGF